jgi:hypothetical protein
MRPPGLWGAKEFVQFTEDELHATMIESHPGGLF